MYNNIITVLPLLFSCIRQSHITLMHRGALKYHTKLYSGAVSDFSTAIRLDPRHASLGHFNRALCYQATGKLQMVLSCFQKQFHSCMLLNTVGAIVIMNFKTGVLSK